MNKYTNDYPSTIRLKEGFYNLIYTNHAKQRFNERHGTDPVMPKLVNVTKNNVVSLWTEDDLNINRILIRLIYRKDNRGNPLVFLYLVLIPHESVVKSLWFRDVKRHRYARQNNKMV